MSDYERLKFSGPDVQVNDSEELQKYGYRFDKRPVSPGRVARADELGIPILETICALSKWERMVDPSGNVCDVPLRTGRVLSMEPEAEKYEFVIRKEAIQAGWLPLRECPHTAEYKASTNRATLVPLPVGQTACEGKDGGCDHMWNVIEKRQTLSRTRWQSQQYAVKQMTPEEAIKMGREIGAGLASGLDPVAAAKAAREAMKSGKGESNREEK